MVCNSSVPYQLRTGCFKTHIIYPIVIPTIMFLMIYLSLYLGKDQYEESLNRIVVNKNYENYMNFRKSEKNSYIVLLCMSIIEVVLISIMLTLLFLYVLNINTVIERIYKQLVFCIIVLSVIRLLVGLLVPSIKVSFMERIYVNYAGEFPMQFIFGSVGLIAVLFIYITMNVFNSSTGTKDINISNWYIVSVVLILVWRFARSIYNIVESVEFIEVANSDNATFAKYLQKDNDKWFRIFQLDDIYDIIHTNVMDTLQKIQKDFVI